MTMAQREFESIAGAMRRTVDNIRAFQFSQDDVRAAQLGALKVASQQLAKACAAQYKGRYAFDHARFMSACGFPEGDES